jgi:hypothetical protein
MKFLSYILSNLGYLRRHPYIKPYSHCKQDPIYVFPEMKLCGLVPNFHIQTSVNDWEINISGTMYLFRFFGTVCLPSERWEIKKFPYFLRS